MGNSDIPTLKNLIDFHTACSENQRTIGATVLFLFEHHLIGQNQLKNSDLPLNYWREIFNVCKDNNTQLFDIAKEKLNLSSDIIIKYADQRHITIPEAVVGMKAERILCEEDIPILYTIGDKNKKMREKILQIFSLIDELRNESAYG